MHHIRLERLLCALAVTGCATERDIAQYCAAYTDCVGGSFQDQVACEVDLREAVEDARGSGCRQAFEDEIACFSERAECVDGELILDACSEEMSASLQCSMGSGCG